MYNPNNDHEESKFPKGVSFKFSGIIFMCTENLQKVVTKFWQY